MKEFIKLLVSLVVFLVLVPVKWLIVAPVINVFEFIESGINNVLNTLDVKTSK